MLSGKIQSMMKFKDWLDADETRAPLLQQALGVNRASISNVRTGRRPMPREWVPLLVAMSKNKLTYKSLVHEMIDTKRALGTLRMG